MNKIFNFTLAVAAVALLIGLASLQAGKEKDKVAGGTGEKSDIAAAIEGKLVRPDGSGGFEASPVTGERAPEYYAIYYSAHWCGPCRAFTPKLVEFYNAQKAKHGNFELIFVSSDTDEKAMYDYMTGDGMKWPALKYSERNATPAITKYAGPGIPCLVILDAEGNVVANSFEGSTYVGPYVPMQELEKLLEKSSS